MLSLLSLHSPRFLGRIALLVACCAPMAYAQKKITINGFVTFAGTPTDFRVNEQPVTCIPGTTRSRVVAKQTTEQPGCLPHFTGESITVKGQQDKATGTISAASLESDAPGDENVQGFAVISRILAPLKDGTLTVRADGYPVKIDPSTRVTLDGEGGLKTLAAVDTNLWLRYSGVLQPDGIVHATTATFTVNEVGNQEAKLRKKTDFDAARVNEDKRQNEVGKYFFGMDPTRIPAYHDDAMQTRLNTLGERLIPAYQRGLKDDDPTKVNFRFQLVDQPKLEGCLALASGIVLVPYQVVQRLDDDSELAALLATEIADVIDKQALRNLRASHARTAVTVAGTAVSLFVPGANLATGIGNAKAKSVLERHEAEQRSREGLALMQDAGFDVSRAPLVWWRLHAHDLKTLTGVTMPQPTQYTYQVLAALYRQTASVPPETNSGKAE